MAQGEITPTVLSAPPLQLDTRINLSIMMFLQFAIWGSWATVVGNRLRAMGLGDSVGRISATMALGTIFAPLIVGQIADRYFSSEKLMAIFHLIGAGLLYWLASIPPVVTGAPEYAAQVASTTATFYWVSLAYALIYSPTLALSSSIAFTHVPDGTRDFPGIRVLGTIGWIVAGLLIGYGLQLFFPDPEKSNGPFLLAAAFSLVAGIQSFFLPHTPPKGKAGDAIPFLRALKLLREPSFAVFFGVSFIITIVLAFYYSYTGVYLEAQIGIKRVGPTLTIGQISEMVLLPFLPLMLRRFGMKWVLAIGMLAWGLRYAVFAWGGSVAPEVSLAPVIICLTLHGVCYDFFFAAGFIHVNDESPNDIKGSAQALFVFLTYGLGMWLGGELSGMVFNHFTQKSEGPEGKMVTTTDWTQFWAFPSIGVLIALVAFVLFFHMKSRSKVTTTLTDEPVTLP